MLGTWSRTMELVVALVSFARWGHADACPVGLYAGQNCEIPDQTVPCTPRPEVLDVSFCESFIVGRSATFEVDVLIPPRHALIIGESASLKVSSSLNMSGSIIAKHASNVNFYQDVSISGERFVVESGAVVEVKGSLTVSVANFFIAGSVSCNWAGMYASKDFVVMDTGSLKVKELSAQVSNARLAGEMFCTWCDVHASNDLVVEAEIHIVTLSDDPVLLHNDGYMYRTLTGLPRSARDDFCESTYTKLPDGWSLAPFSDDVVQNVVGSHDWSTHLMVLADRIAYPTRLGSGIASRQPSLLLVDAAQAYAVGICAAAILIRRRQVRNFSACGTMLLNSVISSDGPAVMASFQAQRFGGAGAITFGDRGAVDVHFHELLNQTPEVSAARVHVRPDFLESTTCSVVNASRRSVGIRKLEDSIKDLCESYLVEEATKCADVVLGWEECDGSLKKLHDNISHVQQKIVAVEAQHQFAESRYAEALAEVSVLKQKMLEATNSKNICEKDLDSLRAWRASADTRLNEELAKRSALEHQMQDAMGSKSQCEEVLNSVEAQLKEASTELTALTSSKNTCVMELDSLQDNISHVQQKIVAVEAQHQFAESRHAEALAEVSMLKQKMLEAINSKNFCEKDLDSLRAWRASADTRLNEELAKKSALEHQIQEAIGSKSQCEEVLNSVEAQLKEASTELTTLTSSKNTCVLELDFLRGEIQSAPDLNRTLGKHATTGAQNRLNHKHETPSGNEQCSSVSCSDVCMRQIHAMQLQHERNLGICGIISSSTILIVLLTLCIVCAILASLCFSQFLVCRKLQNDVRLLQDYSGKAAVSEARNQWLEEELQKAQQEADSAKEQFQTERMRSAVVEKELETTKTRLNESQSLYDVAASELRASHLVKSRTCNNSRGMTALSEEADSERSFGATTASWIDVSKVPAITGDEKPKCFLPNYAFKAPGGHLVLVQNLEEGAQILLSDGSEASVTSIKRYPFNKKEPYNLCTLVTAQGQFVVSVSHNVDTKDGKRQAGDLRIGDEVIVGSRYQPLLNITQKKARTDLFMVSFAPPGSVEAFPIPSHGLQTFGEPQSEASVDHVDTSIPDVETLQAAQLLHLIGCASVTEDILEAAMPTEYAD